MNDIRILLGNEIKLKRKKMNLTQNDLAEKINLSRTYIADVEGGRYFPSLNTLTKIANELNLNLGILSDIQVKEK